MRMHSGPACLGWLQGMQSETLLHRTRTVCALRSQAVPRGLLTHAHNSLAPPSCLAVFHRPLMMGTSLHTYFPSRDSHRQHACSCAQAGSLQSA